MKIIMEGLRYDTDTAEEVASYNNGYCPADFNYIYRTLYRTERGNWFCVNKGGANTAYAESYGDSRSEGTRVEPMGDPDAYDLLEQWGATDALEKYFSGEIEDA